MDVPSSAMGERILYTGDEVCFHINEKNAVKIDDERCMILKLETKPRHYPIFGWCLFLWSEWHLVYNKVFAWINVKENIRI